MAVYTDVSFEELEVFLAAYALGEPHVFKGIAEFAVESPAIITGDNYEHMTGPIVEQGYRCKINNFNISKITSEVRGGKSPPDHHRARQVSGNRR